MTIQKRHGYYAFLFRHSPRPEVIHKFGGEVYHVGRYSSIVSAIVSPDTRMDAILSDPRILAADRDLPIFLPFPKVERVIHTTRRRPRQQAAKQRTTWNVARVLGNRPRPNNGRKIRVGVIDTGIDLNHPDLAANIKGGANIVTPSNRPQDDNGHGTHVAGIIGAVNNQTGVVGVAPAVSLYAIKVLNEKGSGTLTTLIKGIEWAIRNNMDILNISISGGSSLPPMLAQVVQSATDRGILIVGAAGNSGNLSGEGDNVGVPARLPNVVAVAALNRQNKRAPFSATGPSIDIAAPGVNILSAYVGHQYATLTGTSMAAPHVTGVAAMMKRMNPHLSPANLRQMLQNSAAPLPASQKRLTGAGLVRIRA